MDAGVDAPPTFVTSVVVSFQRKWQHYIDRTKMYTRARWAAFGVLLFLYMTRVYLANAWHIITYGLGIFLLNNFIGFLSPQHDDGPVLPSRASEEFRPFTRRLPEFDFWYTSTRAILIAFCMTMFEFFDIPVFWPILLMYFIVLFVITMRRQIKDMWEKNYVPWSRGKPRFEGGGKAGKDADKGSK